VGFDCALDFSIGFDRLYLNNRPKPVDWLEWRLVPGMTYQDRDYCRMADSQDAADNLGSSLEIAVSSQNLE
jgi:hypothetical protein